MNTSNPADIDSLLAEYSEQVAEHGVDSQQEKQFYGAHRDDKDFVELADVLKSLRQSPPRLNPTDGAGMLAQSRISLGSVGLSFVFVTLMASTTWLGVERVMDSRPLASPGDASMYAMRESASVTAADETAPAIAVNDQIIEIASESEPAWEDIVSRKPEMTPMTAAMQEPEAEILAYRAPAMAPTMAEVEAVAVPWATMGSHAMRVSEDDPHEDYARFLADAFSSDGATANLLAEAFLHDAKASWSIDLTKLNLAYAFARLAVELEAAPPTQEVFLTDASPSNPWIDDAGDFTWGRSLDTYGQVLDAIAATMRDQGQERVILTLNRSSGDDWQRIIAAFEATLEHPGIDEASKTLALERIEILKTGGSETRPAEDDN